jgi:hypothetical protein
MKFKNINRKAKKNKSPSNSRSIPASPQLPPSPKWLRRPSQRGETEQFKFSIPKINHATLFKVHRNALKIFVLLMYVATFTVIVLDFKHYLPVKENIESKRSVLARDLNFWDNYISNHQNFADGYFQASVLAYELGDSVKAKIYAEKGLILDPNSKTGRKIEKLLK